MGNWAPGMAEAASVISDAGADIVDVNLGCPTKRALKGNVGAAMLRDPILLFDVLSAMRAEVPGIFSAKIRAGFDDAKNVVHIAQTVERAGLISSSFTRGRVGIITKVWPIGALSGCSSKNSRSRLLAMVIVGTRRMLSGFLN